MAPASTTRRRASRAEAEKLPPAIRLRRKGGNRTKRLSTGFAWDLFLFAGLFGIPQFLRRLPQWGAAVLALWCVVLVVGRIPLTEPAARAADAALFAIFLALQLWLGFSGNRLTAKALLARGWALDQPGDLGTRRVVERWKLESAAR